MRRVGFGASLAAAALAVGALAACASSGGQPAGGQPSTVALRQADEGRRVSVATHSTLVVRLDNTYWQFQPPSSTHVLRLLGVTVHRDAHAVLGSGRGTVVARYRAVAPGQAVLAATRRICGEALACPPGQRTYRVTVVVRS